MIKCFKVFYNFLMKLKQYHAVHIWVIIPGLFWAITYILFWLSVLVNRDEPNTVWLISMGLIICYCEVILYTFFLSILIGTTFFIYELITQKNITVKSKFLLHNKFYNFIYLLTLLNYLLLSLEYCCNFPDCLKFYIFCISNIYTFPWLYLIK